MPGKTRNKKDYLKLGRTLAENHFKTESKKSKINLPEFEQNKPVNKALFKISQFFDNHLVTWFYHYIRSRFGRKHPFQTYGKNETGIYKFPNTLIKIACAADWASDTAESETIAYKISSSQPEYTIHLGDTYFVGEPDEIKANFIDKNSTWHRGSKGSFALLGNHEMFSRGIGYFKNLLPSMGIKSASGKYSGQKASFFCLENDYWRVIGLDTGYNSIGAVPIIENMDFIEKIPLIGNLLAKILIPQCSLHDKLIEWLKKNVKLDTDKRGIIFLSHHQYCSAFEKDFEVLGMQLGKLVGSNRPVLWIWGHEHRMSIYGLYGSSPCIKAYGRCIGHGGMPVELVKILPKNNKINKKPLVLFDNRKKETIDGVSIGYNGYTLLNFDKDKLEIEYYDSEKRIVSENWEINNKTGKLNGISIESEDKDLTITQELNTGIK